MTLVRIHVLALGVLAAGVSAQQPAAPSRPPNLIFILADDLGYGDLGCYGQEKIATPQLDRMAREGMRFTQFYAGSTVCAPSRCVLMTGLHTGHCFVRGNARHALRPEDVTVAEVMKRRGYTTALVGKWGLGEPGTLGVPTKQGFDSFFGYLNQRHAHNYYPDHLYRDETRVPLRNVLKKPSKDGSGVATEKVEYSHDLFATEALKFVEDNRGRPFFLYLALTIPHANNEARNKGMEVPDHGQYADRDWPEPQKGHAAMISRMDRDVGRLLQRLRDLGLEKDTLVVFTSDNGPHREGGNRPEFADSNGPLRGIKRDLYEGGIRVPMIAWWPGRVKAGTTSEHIGSFADVMPTAAALCGAEAPAGGDGISFLPALTGEGTQRQHEALYWEFYEGGSAQAVRAGKWKAVRAPMHTGKVQLYDLSRDLGEQSDVAAANADVAARLTKVMEASHTPSPLWQVGKRNAARRGEQQGNEETSAADREVAALLAEVDRSALGHKERHAHFRDRFAALAEKHGGTAAGLRAEVWLLSGCWWSRQDGTMQEQAGARAERILARYGAHPQLGSVFDVEYVFSAQQREDLCGRIMKANLHPAVQAACHLTLAKVFGRSKSEAVRERSRAHLRELVGKFAEVPWRATTYGAMADAYLAPHPREALQIGKVAPDIEGVDVDGNPMRLSDYRGKVVVLDFWGDW